MEIDERTRKALQEEAARVRVIVGSVEEAARDAFLHDEEDMEKLRTLIRVTVEFRHFLLSIPPWPHFPEDPFHNMSYMLDKILFHVDWFRDMVHLYGIVADPKRRTTIDWDTITGGSLRDRFLALYDRFLNEADFQNKFRLLLDLFTLQIVYAGMFYDCKP
jgi:hypothetical protein